MCDNILRNDFWFLFLAFLLAFYVFQEEFNLLYFQSCCYWHMKVLGMKVCSIFYCDLVILISCLYCYFRPVACSYAEFRLAVCSYPSFINFIAMHMELCWLVASDI